ncbi:peptidoglycan DD-metalloendopeptidase family protein [Candidatus Uhrbacteria bacterium]|nr:peptidoglycan DD-metalloendopeptidase family protein [Candidatus Uhrbacteria bacterium]MBD3284177.1 peptidoglycan DD-metalloendopeptidase family protein [Candidatus Uhrbacteria bacterium]
MILPFYKLVTSLRLRYARVAMPARSMMLFLLTNRYLFHGVIVIITAVTVGVNFVARQAKAQDIGQTSLLYAMVTGGDYRTTEEEIHTELVATDARYTGSESIIAVPDIDYHYDAVAQLPVTVPSVPGTIVANLVPHQTDEPESPTQKRTETETYIVKEGDTLSVIASRFGVNIGTVLWANNRSATDYIRPGDALRIPPVSGVLVEVESGDTLLALAKKYGSEVDEIVEINKLNPEEPLPVGVELVLPGGQPPYTPPKAVAYTPNTRPANQFVTKPPDANPTRAPASKLLWPTSGHVITQYYGWGHTGLDIDGHYDSPLYASHDGVVATAGWNSGGYGLQVLVEGSGVKTRYAHASKLFVKAGDKVHRGQVIAMMGTTGRSTGTHLHYEVYIGGRRVNPLAYIK